MSAANLIYDPTDLVFRFGNGKTLLNVVRPGDSDVERLRRLSEENGGLVKVEYVSVDGQLIDVGKVVREHPEILENL